MLKLPVKRQWLLMAVSYAELLAIADKHVGQTVIIVTHGGVLQALYK